MVCWQTLRQVVAQLELELSTTMSISVYQTDRTEVDITVHRTDTTERDTTQGEEKKKSFWSKKKYWILAISLISLLLIALTLGVSLYFGLYSGKHDSKGNYYTLWKERDSFIVFFRECLYEQFYFLPIPG